MRLNRAIHAIIVASVMALLSVNTALAGDVRRVVYPDDPAPTLTQDVAAVRAAIDVSVPRIGEPNPVDASLVGGLQTSRFTAILRDTQRGRTDQPASVGSLSSPGVPPALGFPPLPPGFHCLCVSTVTPTLGPIILPPGH